MVAKVISGKTIRGVISYNENKVKEGTAVCILASRFPGEAGELSFKTKLDTFLLYTSRNTKSKTNAVHISLNFDPKEKLHVDTLKQIAGAYLEKIGFKEQPFLVYQHFDAAHPHVHIVTTNICRNGQRIPLNNIGRDRSEPARREIEIEFNLIKADGRKRNSETLKAADLTRAVYGKSETKRSISNIVSAVTRSYKFTSIHELNAVLKQYNVTADRGEEGTLLHTKNGLRYSLIDKNGKPIGIPIKASSIYGKPTMAALSNQFELNEMLRGPHKERLREVINAFDPSKGKSLNDFIGHMVRNEVYPVIRQNNEGLIYGMTFIDNSTKCVFNGSALGKEYSALGILNRLNADSQIKQEQIPRLPVKEEGELTAPIFGTSSGMNQSEILQTLMEANVDYSNTPYELKRKRRRRGKTI
jgi:hypothetical protein